MVPNLPGQLAWTMFFSFYSISRELLTKWSMDAYVKNLIVEAYTYMYSLVPAPPPTLVLLPL